MFVGAAAPDGWLICDGAAVSRTTQATLFAAIGTAFGAGDGSTTFNLPDMRGQFARGVNTTGSGDDPNRTLGSTQTDSVDTDGISNDAAGYMMAFGGSGAGANGLTGTGPSNQFHWNTAVVRFNPSSGSGDETRPTNVALNFIIRT